MIREAKEDDIPRLLGMSRVLFQRARWPASITLDDASVVKTLTAMIDVDDAVVLTAENGFSGAVVAPAYFNHDILLGKKLWWYTRPGHGALRDALLEEMEQWAFGRGASWFFANSTEQMAGAAVGAVYERRGYVLVERSYMKGLSDGN